MGGLWYTNGMAEIKEFPKKCCPYCGVDHQGYCPRIISITYDEGQIQEIEFLPWWQWPEHIEKVHQDAADKVAQVMAMMQSQGEEH
jgi:hypothetical protein